MPKPTKHSPTNSRVKVFASKRASVVDRIGPIRYDRSHGIKILLYGVSGSGKTTLWSTFPAPILAILCSGGLNSGELRSVDTEENEERIKKVELYEARELAELAEYQKETGAYKTFVLDHATGFQDLSLKEVLGIDEIPAQKSWGLAEQREWGQVGIQCKEILRKMFNLTCNIVVIAQERTFEENSNSGILKPFIGPATTPTVAGWLNQASDYVCQTFKRMKMVEEIYKMGAPGKPKKEKRRMVPARDERGNELVEYCLRTAPHESYNTKFRIPKGTPLPNEIVDPDYHKIMELIRGNKGKI